LPVDCSILSVVAVPFADRQEVTQVHTAMWINTRFKYRISRTTKGRGKEEIPRLKTIINTYR
jgi:hypothetical protein